MASRSPSTAMPIGAEAAEVGVEAVAVGAEHHQLAGLVGRDQQRDAEFLQERRKVAGVHARAAEDLLAWPLEPQDRSVN